MDKHVFMYVFMYTSGASDVLVHVALFSETCQVVYRHLVANCPSLSHARRRVTAAQRCAAVSIQAYIRGFLERRRTAVLRAEMRVFGALQVSARRKPNAQLGNRFQEST